MTLDGNNLNEVIKAAKRKSRDTGETWYVVFEQEHNGCYHAASDHDLDTWYMGNNQIVFCAA